MGLKDATFLVTSACDGVGLACAHRLAAGGAGVVICGVDDEALQHAEGELHQYGVPVYAQVADIARSREVETALGETMRVFGGLDGVVVITAAPQQQPLLETDDEAFDRALAGGVRAAYVVCQRTARLMVGRGRGGSLVLVGPAAAGPGEPGPAAAVAREALAGLARELAVELRPHGIRVNAVVQGPEPQRNEAVASLVAFLMDTEAAPPSGAVIDLGAAGPA